VEVIALCGRTPEPALAMGKKLGIAQVLFDWRKALEDLKPDIVSIATPAKPHLEIVETAAKLGCHICCDKPMGINAAQARAMYLAVEQTGVKHAYAATSRYAPRFIYARKLLADGLIGPVREIESMVHFDISTAPYLQWLHRLDEGGGMLNNVFTHILCQIMQITNGTIVAAAGQAHHTLERALVGETVHDFRDLFKSTPDQPQAVSGEWRDVDADIACTVMLQLRMPDGRIVSALCHGSGISTSAQPEHWGFYGDKGTLFLTDTNGVERIQHFDKARMQWQDIQIPQSLTDSLPQIADHFQRNWNQLFIEFANDIRGQGYAGYPTFRDGWIASEVIDIVRGGVQWIPLAEHP
jgi:predicted dehydrogenase